MYAQDDLGGLYGQCECCGTSLRHVFYVQHEKWEPMAVGTDCCDNLTGTTEATEHRKMLGRRKRFLSSKRWKHTPLGLLLEQGRALKIEIRRDNDSYRIYMNGVRGGKTFNSEAAAKAFSFELIENGEAQKFAMRHPRREDYA